MSQLQLPIVEGVASKLDRILALTQGKVKRASDLKPTTFDARGERHARAIAEADGDTPRPLGSSGGAAGSVA